MTMQNKIENLLQNTLSPDHLIVKNESFMHAVPQGSETHFKVVIVSDRFKEMRLLQRHRLVQEQLQNEVTPFIKALSLETHTVAEWQERGEVVSRSPGCTHERT